MNGLILQDRQDAHDKQQLMIKMLKKEHAKKLQEMDSIMLRQEEQITNLKYQIKHIGKENNLDPNFGVKSMRILGDNSRSRNVDDLSDMRSILQAERVRINKDKDKIEEIRRDLRCQRDELTDIGLNNQREKLELKREKEEFEKEIDSELC